ncbi:unnamed protein product, partial [Pleuronectes platessa]
MLQHLGLRGHIRETVTYVNNQTDHILTLRRRQMRNTTIKINQQFRVLQTPMNNSTGQATTFTIKSNSSDSGQNRHRTAPQPPQPLINHFSTGQRHNRFQYNRGGKEKQVDTLILNRSTILEA